MTDPRKVTLKEHKQAEPMLNAPLEKIVGFMGRQTLHIQIAAANSAEQLILRAGGTMATTRMDIVDTLYSRYRRFGDEGYAASENQLRALWDSLQAEYRSAVALKK